MCNNTRYQKSIVRAYNNSTQTITADQTTLALQGAQVVNSGCSVGVETAAYRIRTGGIYHISADVTLTATAAGTATVQIALNTVALPCAVSTVTTAANGTYTVHVETDISVPCCPAVGGRTVTITAGGVAGTVTHVCSGVTRLA